MDGFVSVDDFEKAALEKLDKNALDYYRSGAGRQQTLKDNKEAFSNWRIRPRCLTNVTNADVSTTVLGEKVSMPVGISPSAFQKMAHPDGECASVRAAQSMGTIYILSTISTSSIEEVAEAAPNAIKWFQLYIYTDREVTKSLVKRAEAAGFKALVLTVDTPKFGLRLQDIRNKFQLPPHLKLANFQGKYALTVNKAGKRTGSAMNDLGALFDDSLTWKDIEWLRSITQLPIVLKGILTAEDALCAADSGASAVMVSNHGARQVDGWPASIEALPEIVKAVGNKMEIYMDGGISDGTDVLKALGLGAKMVFIGRPTLWGLACGGEEGVKKVLEILKVQFEFAMTISGCQRVSDIQRSMVAHKYSYSKL